jgi:hypothetical protein
MELEAISGAATVALTSTIVFLLVAKTWNAISRSFNSTPNFSDSIMREAAQRFRDELDRLTSSQSTYLSGILVFVMLFVAAYVLQAGHLFTGYPSWQLYLQLGFLVLVSAFAVFYLVKMMRLRHHIKFVRDANIAIGHQLQKVSTGGTRVFHDVETSAGTVDHLIIGQKGLYAINVVAQRPSNQGQARLRSNQIEFSSSKTVQSIVSINAMTSRLRNEFQELLGHEARVRSVIAVPGWHIAEQSSNEHLLVNERTIVKLSGRKDEYDNIMKEDVVALQTELMSRCAKV